MFSQNKKTQKKMVFFNATFDMQKITNIILTVLRNAYLDVKLKINYISEMHSILVQM